MAEVTGFGLDLSSFISQADKADRKILDMVQHAQQLQTVLTNTFNGATTASFTSVMDRLASQVNSISNKKVSPDFNTKEAEKLYGIMNGVVQVMQMLGQNKVPLFDTQNVYATNQGLFTAQDNLRKINDAITVLKEKWKTQEESVFTPTNFDIPKYEPLTNDKGKAYGKNTKIQKQHRAEYDEKIKLLREWEAAYNKHQEQIFNQEKKSSQLAIELELRELIEKKAIASEELKWAKMTQDERSQYVLKKMAEELNVEQSKLNEVRKNYRSYLSEMNTLSSQIERNQRKDVNGVTAKQIETQKARFLQLDSFKRELETNYGAFLVDIAEKANARAANITAERLRREADAKKAAEEAQWQKYLSSPEGALTLASEASTRGEMKEAQKYLQSALDVVNKDDVDLIKKINNEYQRLRINIEQLSKASQNETTLLPTVRNEYSRLLRDLHKVAEAKERASKTAAYKAGDSAAIQSYNDLLAREQDLQNKIADIRRNAKGQLAEEDRKFNAEIAAQNVAETEKAERQKFEAERKRLLEIQELRRQTATRSTARANQIVNQTENVKSIAQEEQAVKRLEDTRRRLNKNDADYEATLKRLNEAIARHTHNIKMATDASYREAQAKKQAQQQNTTYQGAMDYSKNVKSINDQIKAIEYLKQARANLDKTSMSGVEYEHKIKRLTEEIKRQQTELDRLTGKSKELKSGFGVLGKVASQLKTQLTALFGIAAIKGYLQKLVDVRKEFERQQTALKGILQSKDEADKLWNQTTQLALKSPFSIRELITYTKQLAAYRIETDKLHDTTKRLADVSAGLGVDMSRLILAYGQVRAAEYLRGTELRQFTEAGIPMLDELARYFTEIEGRAISTAEVFDMISKRMVEFEDVAEVFNRMTSEGGVFFEMQEQQSKTLYGELSNLKDAYELMLNEIGKNNEGTIKGVISGLRELIKNWRVVVDTIDKLLPLIVSLGSVFLVAKISATKFAHSLVALSKQSNTLAGWNIAFNRHIIATARESKLAAYGLKLLGGAIRGIAAIGVMAAIGFLIEGIVKLASNLAQAGARARELKDAFAAINVEITGEFDKGIKSYKELVAQINDVTLSYEEREKAMQRLKRQFQDILPDQYLELEYIEKTTDAYSEATDALRNYYNAKTREQKESKLNDIFGEDILKEAAYFQNKFANTFATRLGISSKSVRSVLDKTIEEVKKGTIEADKLYEEFLERLQTYSGRTISDVDYKTFYKFNVTTLKTLMDVLKDYERYRGDISGLSFETKVEEDRFYAKQKANEQLEIEKGLISQLTNAYNEYYKTQRKIAKYGSTSDLIAKQDGYKQDIEKIYNELNISFPFKEFLNISSNAHDIDNEVERVTKYIYNRFQEKIKKEAESNSLLLNFSDELKEAIISIDKNKNIKDTTEGLFRAISNQFSISLSAFDKFKASSDSTIDSVRKKIEDEIEIIQTKIDEYNKASATMPKIISLQHKDEWLEATTGLNKEKLTEYTTLINALTLAFNALGGKAKKEKENKEEKTLADVLKIIEDTHKEYKNLTKTLDHAQSKELALAKNANAFAEAVKGIPSLAKFKLDDFAFDQEDGAIESLEKLKTLIPTTAKNYKSLMVDIEKAIGDLRGEATIEAKVKADEELIQSIEEMFDGYELSLELDKLGLPKNFMSDLFNIDTFNLDQIRTKIENEISRIKSSEETKQGEKDRLKELEKQLQKVDDMEEKQMQERLKKYSKYLLKSQSEAVKIKLDELRQIEEIENLQNVSSAQKTAMKQGVKDEAQKKLEKNTWDTFKEGETYIRLFEDLEYQSVKSLRSMRSELTQMRDNLKNLDPSALKEISDKIDSLDEQIVKRNPFKALGQAYKDFISVYKRYGSEKELEDKLQQSINDRDSTSALIYNQELDVRQAQKKVDDALLSNDKVRIANAKLNLYIQENTLNTLKEKFKNDEKTIELLDEALSKLQKSRKMFSGGIGEIGGDISAIASSLPTIMGDLESMGIRFSEEMRDSVESISEIGQGVGNAIQGFASGNYLQGIMGVTSALAAVFKVGDKSKERRIQREIRLIEDLGRQYEKLQKQIDNAYSLDTFRESYAEAQKNLDEQIAATERMIEAEKAKKNTDNERIKEWQHQLEEYEQQKQELLDKQLQELGGFGESGYKDAAQQFVDAWVEAFRETGDGLSALEDKWDEYIQNVIRKQMSMKIANKLVEPLLTELDKALEDDSYLSTEELEKIDKLSKDAFPKLNEALQQISELYGSEWLKTNGELSGLTSGIQGVTEQTADQLAGLINSIRLYVANNNRELLNIANTLKESLQIENPMLSQLKLIATHTDNINTLLESVVGQYHSGGRGIKVIM